MGVTRERADRPRGDEGEGASEEEGGRESPSAVAAHGRGPRGTRAVGAAVAADSRGAPKELGPPKLGPMMAAACSGRERRGREKGDRDHRSDPLGNRKGLTAVEVLVPAHPLRFAAAPAPPRTAAAVGALTPPVSLIPTDAVAGDL